MRACTGYRHMMKENTSLKVAKNVCFREEKERGGEARKRVGVQSPLTTLQHPGAAVTVF